MSLVNVKPMKVFVTVGSEIGFDRLIRAVDTWLSSSSHLHCFMQIADGEYLPENAHFARHLSTHEFANQIHSADLVISHAGTGTMVHSLGLGKSLIVLPRRASLRETRSEHQLATCKRFSAIFPMRVAWSEVEVPSCIEGAIAALVSGEEEVRDSSPMSLEAGPHLLRTIQDFVDANTKIGEPVLCICTGGGHLNEMLRIIPAIQARKLALAVTRAERPQEFQGYRFRTLTEGHRWNKIGLVRMLAEITQEMVVVRPKAIVSTGSAPGYFALRLGAFLSIPGLWLDSIANAEQLSLSGTKAGRYAKTWLTQWPDLARLEGPLYAGSTVAKLESQMKETRECENPNAVMKSVNT